MRFNEEKVTNLPNLDSFDINRLITIDTIHVDCHSRLTLTRNLKKLLPIFPKDVITVYQDRYNKDLIFSIQHESNTVDSFIIKSNSGITTTTISNRGKKHTGDNRTIDQSAKKSDTLHDVNILIVDDEEDILKVFEYGLSEEGYDNIQTFSDSKKVIKHFVELKKPDYYDLAIIDIRMPSINGIQLHQILKILNPKMKVIFASALDAANELTSLYNIRKEDVIKKPTELKELVNTINSALLKEYKNNESLEK